MEANTGSTTRKTNALLVCAVITSLVAGCGTMTTSPLATSQSGDDGDVASVRAAVSEDGGYRMPADPNDGDGGGPRREYVPSQGEDTRDVLARFTPGGATSSPMVDKSATATGTIKLKNGRWTLDVPSNAVADGSTVTLSVPTTAAWGCELEIAPADPDGADSPMTLTVDCHGVPPKRLATYAILVYDSSTRTWSVAPGSRVDSKKKTVSAQITRFAIYAVGTDPNR